MVIICTTVIVVILVIIDIIVFCIVLKSILFPCLLFVSWCLVFTFRHNEALFPPLLPTLYQLWLCHWVLGLYEVGTRTTSFFAVLCLSHSMCAIHLWHSICASSMRLATSWEKPIADSTTNHPALFYFSRVRAASIITCKYYEWQLFIRIVGWIFM